HHCRNHSATNTPLFSMINRLNQLRSKPFLLLTRTPGWICLIVSLLLYFPGKHFGTMSLYRNEFSHSGMITWLAVLQEAGDMSLYILSFGLPSLITAEILLRVKLNSTPTLINIKTFFTIIIVAIVLGIASL